ncbi:coiled-coil domain-containing protein [Alkaliphilus serpentinus]|uniref:Uncharacterized protein n=1 Tax=Alkaliphilus serpentinus TaxID=1482731 RepID=A0A833HPB9_9FIRM|nr:hypothetical protein [Alkaliphilus serpentinus]KAB3529591.1 hypothetical protein F8153_09050 [Alkaliphilus serpentinus]
MIKRKIILLFAITLILISCNNDTQDLSNENSELRAENEYLLSEIEVLRNDINKKENVILDLESEIKGLESTIEELSQNVETINTDISFTDKYNEYDEQRKKSGFDYLKDNLISIGNTEKKTEYKNLFEPEFVRKGDIFGDSKVVDTYITDSFKSILFENKYEVTATYICEVIGNILIIDNFREHIPYTIYDIERGMFVCEVSNQEEFINQLGDSFKLELGYGVKVKAIFKNLYYNILYESDMYSTIEFVELIEIIEE